MCSRWDGVNVSAHSGNFGTSGVKANSTHIASSVDSEPRVMKILGYVSGGQEMGVGTEVHKDKNLQRVPLEGSDTSLCRGTLMA